MGIILKFFNFVNSRAIFQEGGDLQNVCGRIFKPNDACRGVVVSQYDSARGSPEGPFNIGIVQAVSLSSGFADGDLFGIDFLIEEVGGFVLDEVENVGWLVLFVHVRCVAASVKDVHLLFIAEFPRFLADAS